MNTCCERGNKSSSKTNDVEIDLRKGREGHSSDDGNEREVDHLGRKLVENSDLQENSESRNERFNSLHKRDRNESERDISEDDIQTENSCEGENMGPELIPIDLDERDQLEHLQNENTPDGTNKHVDGCEGEGEGEFDDLEEVLVEDHREDVGGVPSKDSKDCTCARSIHGGEEEEEEEERTKLDN